MKIEEMAALKPGDELVVDGHEGVFTVIAVEGFPMSQPRVVMHRSQEEGQTSFGLDSLEHVHKAGAKVAAEPVEPEPEVKAKAEAPAPKSEPPHDEPHKSTVTRKK